MWRYYELLTDTTMAEIASLRAAIERGERHPMATKMELARRIVSDFHSAEAATAAQEEFERVFRRHELPTEMETVRFPVNGDSIKVDKLLAEIGLADSVSDAARKRKAGGVQINGSPHGEAFCKVSAGQQLVIQVGKRAKRVVIERQ